MLQVNARVSNQQIADQLITAFEGGINYWCRNVRVMRDDGVRLSDNDIMDRPDDLERCTIEVYEIDGGIEPRTLKYADFKPGLEVMAKDYPEHFANLITDNGDADTADIFMQCCLFGEVIYG